MQLRSLPASIRSALEGAESSAGHLSDDRLQGLAELIQNADDLGASDAVFAVDEAGSRLLFRHNGDGLTLHDVWGLAIPWLSLKVTDAEQLGRFGIGLKTLHSLSDILEAHMRAVPRPVRSPSHFDPQHPRTLARTQHSRVDHIRRAFRTRRSHNRGRGHMAGSMGRRRPGVPAQRPYRHPRRGRRDHRAAARRPR